MTIDENSPDSMFGSDVAIWLERMGYNGKQVSKAAEAIGISGRQLVRKRDGEGGADLSHTERLAMAALRAGLPAWSPETDAYLDKVRQLRESVAGITGWSPPSS